MTLTERALHGMLEGLDPYSRYYDRGEAEQARRIIDGDFRGIGVVFQAGVEDGRVLFPRRRIARRAAACASET